MTIRRADVVLRFMAGVIGTAGMVACVLAVADVLGLLQWPPHYEAGEDEQWPLDVITTSWLTGSVTALCASWKAPASLPRHVLRVASAVLGGCVVGAVWLQWRAEPPARVAISEAQWHLIAATLIGGGLGLLGRYRAVRYGVGIPVVVVAAALVWAQATGSHFPQETALGEIHTSTYGSTRGLSTLVTAPAVGVLAGLSAVIVRRSEHTVAAVIGPVVGIAFLLGVFYLVGFDDPPDHNITLDPLYRVWVWLIAAAAGSFAASRLKTGYDQRRPTSTQGTTGPRILGGDDGNVFGHPPR